MPENPAAARPASTTNTNSLLRFRATIRPSSSCPATSMQLPTAQLAGRLLSSHIWAATIFGKAPPPLLPGGAWGQRLHRPPPMARVDVFVCPDDSSVVMTPVVAPLTYVVNLGVYGGGGGTNGLGGQPSSPPNFPTPFVNANSRPLQFDPSDPDRSDRMSPVLLPTGPSPGGLGVFRNYAVSSAGAISMSDVKSPSQTVLLSERVFSPATLPRQWHEATWTPVTAPARLGFTWPNFPPRPYSPANGLNYEQPLYADSGLNPTSPNPLAPLPSARIGVQYQAVVSNNPVSYLPPLPSVHAGVVIITFCDGHTLAVRDDTLCTSYLAIP